MRRGDGPFLSFVTRNKMQGGYQHEQQAGVNDAVLQPKRRARFGVPVAATAAICAVLALALFMMQPEAITPSPPESPITENQEPTPVDGPIAEVIDHIGGMGCEAFMAYSALELENGNPWTPAVDLKTLPVFKSSFIRDGAGVPMHGLSEAQMMAKAKQVAADMGYKMRKVYSYPSEEELQRNAKIGAGPNVVCMAVAESDDARIEVEASGEITIWLEPALSLPTAYGKEATREEANATLAYLLAEYAPLLEMASSAPALSSDYSYAADRYLWYAGFENKGDLTERILGFNFDTIRFALDNDGRLYIIRRNQADLSQKIGDFPIISPDRAKELLLAGQCFSTVQEPIPGEQYVASVELIYRATGEQREYLVPYYRFLVEIPSWQLDNGLKTFGAFYVPAVEAKHLGDIPLWRDGFN